MLRQVLPLRDTEPNLGCRGCLGSSDSESVLSGCWLLPWWLATWSRTPTTDSHELLVIGGGKEGYTALRHRVRCHFQGPKKPWQVLQVRFHSSGGLSGSSEGFRHFCDCLNTVFRVFVLGAKNVKRMGGNTVILSVSDTKTPSKTPQGPQKAAKPTHFHLGTSVEVD